MREEQLNQLPSQGTIYSVTKLGSHVIIGTGDYGKVFAHISTATMQQLPLQNLPYECDIVSVDAYIDAFPVLAVAYVQKCNPATYGAMPDGRGGNGFVTSHLNIYSTWISIDQQDSPTSTSSTSSEGSKFKHSFHLREEFHSSQFELLAQNCTTFRLDYIPFHLLHMQSILQNGNFGNILLLSGSDRKVHSFEADDDNLVFVEVPVKLYFPELGQKFPGVVTRMLIQPVNELTRRITICGLETGNLLIWIVTSKYHRRRKRMDSEATMTSGSITPSRSLHSTFESFNIDPWETKITIKQEESEPKVEGNAAEGPEGGEEEEEEEEELMDALALETEDESFDIIEHHYEGLITAIKSFSDGFNLNVIVSSSMSPTFVYTNVIEENFNAGNSLKFSSRWDAVECCCVEDVDRDGENEIIIGTFGCTLLVYKYMDEILPAWVIVAKETFPRPVLAVEFINNNLHVVTGLGLHIVNYDTCAYFAKSSLSSSEHEENVFDEPKEESSSSSSSSSTQAQE